MLARPMAIDSDRDRGTATIHAWIGRTDPYRVDATLRDIPLERADEKALTRSWPDSRRRRWGRLVGNAERRVDGNMRGTV
jgi:hypothetical protein